MMATSGVLNTLRVPFTYINNCRIDDDQFRQGLERFVRAAGVVKTVKTMKIGQIGQRIDFFWSTIVNEAELLERFGIQVLPIDAVNLIRTIRERVAAQRPRYQEELAQFRAWIDFNHFPDDDAILASLAFRDLLLEIAQREDLDGFCFQTFDSFPAEFRAFLCFGCCPGGRCRVPRGPRIGRTRGHQFHSAGGRRWLARAVVPAGHYHPPSRERQCRAAMARRCPLVAPRSRRPGQARPALDL